MSNVFNDVACCYAQYVAQQSEDYGAGCAEGGYTAHTNTQEVSHQLLSLKC
jgi:hypothetical protein